MDIPTVLHSVARAEQRNPYLRADSLAELLAWHDLDFVRCAYVTVLGRQPDPIGEAYYVDRIRRGHSKLEILQQLRRSPEGPKHDPGIAGFDRALKKSVLQRQPLLGWFFRMLWPAPASIAPGEWQFRAMMNALEANAAAVGSIAAHLQILAQAPDSTNRSKEGSQAQAHSLVPEPTSPIGRCGARGAATRIVPELQHLRSRGPLAGYMARKLS